DDGIRGGHVTAVQTCALPIYARLLPGVPTGLECGGGSRLARCGSVRFPSQLRDASCTIHVRQSESTATAAPRPMRGIGGRRGWGDRKGGVEGKRGGRGGGRGW